MNVNTSHVCEDPSPMVAKVTWLKLQPNFNFASDLARPSNLCLRLLLIQHVQAGGHLYTNPSSHRYIQLAEKETENGIGDELVH